jgi:hypothetical protein
MGVWCWAVGYLMEFSEARVRPCQYGAGRETLGTHLLGSPVLGPGQGYDLDFECWNGKGRGLLGAGFLRGAVMEAPVSLRCQCPMT